jgi:DegV family protein with EDD domain
MRQETELPSEVVENPSRRYCTQFVVEGSGFDVGGLRGELVSLGDSLIIAGSGTKAKIHIHSDSPDAVFHKASSRGSITSQRIEDMAAQFRAAHVPHADIAIVVDSSCDLPAEDWEKNDIYMVPIVLNLEGRSYLDKYTITPEAFFSLIHDGARGHPTTSQPAPAEYRGRFEFLLRHYSSVISLSISSGISGTFDAAKSGARLAGGDVTVIDSKTTSIGLGLLARRIAEAVRAGASKEEAVRLAESLVSRVRVHLAARSLEALVRSGRVGRAKGFAANLLHLAPLIRLNAATDGKPVQGPLFMGVRDGVRKILRHMEREIGGGRPTDFAVAHANAKGNADWFRDRIVKSFSPRREPYVVDATTVLAAHIGEGAVGVGYILEEG